MNVDFIILRKFTGPIVVRLLQRSKFPQKYNALPVLLHKWAVTSVRPEATLQMFVCRFFQCVDKDITFPTVWDSNYIPFTLKVLKMNAHQVYMYFKINVEFQHVWCVFYLHLIARMLGVNSQEISWRLDMILTNLFYTKIFFTIVHQTFHIIGALRI